MANDYTFGRTGGVRGSTPYTPNGVEWLSRELTTLKREVLRLSATIDQLNKKSGQDTAVANGRWRFEERAGVFGVLYVPQGLFTELAP